MEDSTACRKELPKAMETEKSGDKFPPSYLLASGSEQTLHLSA